MRDRAAVVIGLVVGLVACADKAPPRRRRPRPPPWPRRPRSRRVPAGPEIQLQPAAAAKPYVIGTVAIASVDRLLANGTKLVSQAVPLPMDAAGLRDMLLAQAGLPAEVAANIDFAGASAASIIALDQKGKSGAVLAVPARGAAEAQKLIDALGKKIMTRGPATLVEGNTGGRGWLYRADNIVVLSDEVEALARGALLTLEVRRPGADDITGIFYPDALARANGTDVKTAIDTFIKTMAEAGKSAGRGRVVVRRARGDHGAGGRRRQHRKRACRWTRRAGLIVRHRFNARAGTRLAAVAQRGAAVQARPRGRVCARAALRGRRIQHRHVLARRHRQAADAAGDGQAAG